MAIIGVLNKGHLNGIVWEDFHFVNWCPTVVTWVTWVVTWVTIYRFSDPLANPSNGDGRDRIYGWVSPARKLRYPSNNMYGDGWLLISYYICKWFIFHAYQWIYHITLHIIGYVIEKVTMKSKQEWPKKMAHQSCMGTVVAPVSLPWWR